MLGFRFLSLSGLQSACFFAFSLFGISALSFGSTPTLHSSDLSQYRDIHRLIIVFPGDDGKSEAFLDQWDSARIHTRMNHRSLFIFQVKDPKVILALRKMFAPMESGFHVWLVGMDNHLYLTTDKSIEPEDIFARIDELPRRKEEIRRHNNWVGGLQIDA